jgi:hypothetical protein
MGNPALPWAEDVQLLAMVIYSVAEHVVKDAIKGMRGVVVKESE